MRSTLAIDIEAPPALVFALARDLERWPDLLPHYLDVRVLERHADGALTARMVAIRPIIRLFGYGLPVTWRARTWSDDAALQLRFVHQGGATNGMDVTWRIEPTTPGCRVTIEHEFRPRLPGWSSLVDRLFTRPIATHTLATFKAVAEAVERSGVTARAAAGTARPRSGSRRSAKTST
jgi:ribosome-associated toxin RatA of RatAB toxin-antitoxin module